MVNIPFILNDVEPLSKTQIDERVVAISRGASRKFTLRQSATLEPAEPCQFNVSVQGERFETREDIEMHFGELVQK